MRTAWIVGFAALLAVGGVSARAGIGEWTYLGGPVSGESQGDRIPHHFVAAGHPTVLYIISTPYEPKNPTILLVSIDLGTTWQELPVPPDCAGADLFAGVGPNPALYLSRSMSNSSTVQGPTTPYMSTDGGNSWTATAAVPAQLAVEQPADAPIQWKWKSDQGDYFPFLSLDGGKTWSLARKGLRSAPSDDNGGLGLHFWSDPNEPRRVFLYAADALWEYTVAGSQSVALGGDVNGDGKVTVQDAIAILRIVVGLASSPMPAVPSDRSRIAMMPKRSALSDGKRISRRVAVRSALLARH